MSAFIKTIAALWVMVVGFSFLLIAAVFIGELLEKIMPEERFFAFWGRMRRRMRNIKRYWRSRA